MRIDVNEIEASRPEDREVALLAAEVRRLQSVIASSEPTLTDAEREAIELAISKRLDLDAIYTLRNLMERLK
jgi:hypothetical protein